MRSGCPRALKNPALKALSGLAGDMALMIYINIDHFKKAIRCRDAPRPEEARKGVFGGVREGSASGGGAPRRSLRPERETRRARGARLPATRPIRTTPARSARS